MKNMTCHLCNNNTDLKKSHIIPEFVYKELYDEKHKFHVLSTLKQRHKPMEQKGIREKLLCGDCEQQLSVYEKYAREVLLGGTKITIKNDGALVKVSDIDYRKFKLFQLSILWRASISSHPLFSRVNLGPHEEKIKDMIYSNNPGKQFDYPCIMFGLFSEIGSHKNFIDQPRKIHIDGQITYRFVFLGYMWSFYVSSHKSVKLINEVALNMNGEIIIGRCPFEELTELRDFAIELKNMGRLNKSRK